MDANDNQWLISVGREGRIGLDNLGNTCFLNAVIQCLSNTDPLRKYLISNSYEKDINESNPLSSHGLTAYLLSQLLRQLWSNKDLSVKPRRLKGLADRLFGLGQQHDAHEFCAFLLDSLHEDLNRIKDKTNSIQTIEDENELNEQKLSNQSWNHFKSLNDSIVIDLFCGQYLSTIECSICPKLSLKFDPFLYLSLPIPKRYKTIALEECLQLFSAPERLSQQNSWYCPQCQESVEATKRISLWRLPNILMIQLKRFYFDDYMCAEKISSFVGFPIHGLDLSLYCSPKALNDNLSSVYDLYAVVNHYGGVNAGHYTAYAKPSHYLKEEWLCFDDNRVQEITEDSLVTQYAYILFYRRRDNESKYRSVLDFQYC